MKRILIALLASLLLGIAPSSAQLIQGKQLAPNAKPLGVGLLAAGCIADGATDQTSCINAALAAATGCVVVDSTASGFYVAGTIIINSCLVGSTWNPSTYGTGLANSSFIVCNNQAAAPCVETGGTGGQSVSIQNVSFIGKSGTPLSGSIGLQWPSGYNLILTNVQLTNFDTCAYLGPGTGTSPISAHTYNLMLSLCATHYMVNDGAAEVYVTGGRWGTDGGDYNSANDFYYGTRTTNPGNGGGPNTFVMVGTHLNPGGATVGAFFRWGGFTSTTGNTSANRFVGIHAEVAPGGGYTGSATRGMIVADSTVNTFPGLMITDSNLAEDGTKSIPFFNINTSIPWTDTFNISNSYLCSANSTLTVGGVTNSFVPLLDGDFFCGNMTYAAGASNSKLSLANLSGAGLTISGAWTRLSLSNNEVATVDNATGVVLETNDTFRTWTPTVTFGGASVGVTYGTQTGSIVRTASGGYAAYFFLVLTSKGSSTGTARVAGLPLMCGGDLGQNTLSVAVNFASLTSAVLAATAASDTTAVLEQASSSGTSGTQALTDTNFTNTTGLQGWITCGAVQ